MTTDPYSDPTYAPGGPAGASATGADVGSSSPGSTTDTAKAEAGQVKDTAAGAASQVAGTAKDEAAKIVGEAKAQASNLLDQVKGEAGSQLGSQKDRLADLAHSYAKELGSMASGSEESGPVTDLVSDLSRRVGSAGHWLQDHEPADVLDEVRRFARRRPGAFLLASLAAGVVVGRLTRGAVDEHRSESPSSPDETSQPALSGAYPSEPAAVAPAPTGYVDSPPGYVDSPTGYVEDPTGGYGSQSTTTGYGAQPAGGLGEQTVDEAYQDTPTADPYGGGRGGAA